MKRHVLRSLGFAVFALCLLPPAYAQTPPFPEEQHFAPVLGIDVPGAIPGEFVVVLNKTAPNDRVQQLSDFAANAFSGRVHRVYLHALKGFHATLPDEAVDALRRNPLVEYIEANLPGELGQIWGQDRINQRSLPLDGNYFSNRGGSNVKVYVIDSGVERYSRKLCTA
ncbi:MAG: protease inhibitor I9 family protein [Acidobacteriota bacterium]